MAGSRRMTTADLVGPVRPNFLARGLAPPPLALSVVGGVLRHAGDPARLQPFLGLNVAMVMATIMLLGVGLLLG